MWYENGVYLPKAKVSNNTNLDSREILKNDRDHVIYKTYINTKIFNDVMYVYSSKTGAVNETVGAATHNPNLTLKQRYVGATRAIKGQLYEKYVRPLWDEGVLYNIINGNQIPTPIPTLPPNTTIIVYP